MLPCPADVRDAPFDPLSGRDPARNPVVFGLAAELRRRKYVLGRLYPKVCLAAAKGLFGLMLIYQACRQPGPGGGAFRLAGHGDSFASDATRDGAWS